MKASLFSFCAFAVLNMTAYGSEDVETVIEALTKSRVGGEFRTIYQHNSKLDHLDGSNGSSDTGVVGGKVELQTRTYKGFDAVVSGYGTVNLGSNRNQTDGDYVNNGKNNGNYGLLGQAFMRYSRGESFIRAGRFELDTPLLNSDDIRMVPNLFQGVHGVYSPVEDVSLEAGYINRMAGWENGGNNAHFTKIGTLIDGMQMLDSYSAGKSVISFAGISYGNEEAPFSVRVYDYMTKNIMNQVYTDTQLNTGIVSLQGQYLRSLGDDRLKKYVNDNSLSNVMIDSTVWGLSLGIQNEEPKIEASIAFNRSKSKDAALFNGGTPDYFGGSNDPFYTSMDVLTMHQMGNTKAYKVDVGYEPTEEIVLDAAYAFFKKDNGFNNHETDLSMTYGLQDNVSLEGIVSKVVETDQIGKQTTNNRARLMVRVGF